MKPVLFTLLLSMTALPGAFAQPAVYSKTNTGNWVGVNKNKMVLLFHIVADTGAQHYKATWDSYTQGMMGLSCKEVRITADSMILTINNMKTSYQGKFTASGNSMDGIWTQNGQTIPLSLKRMLRPQTPRPPFPYISDSVEYNNAAGTVHLGATLTRPAGNKKYPAVILITGSGLQDRDETIFDHKPFAVMADYLTRRGIAVLRVDDRRTGKSTGDVNNATSADFADDVVTSLHYLQTRNDIDIHKIGLVGHSEGGIIAPMVAARHQKEISFIVLWGAAAVSGEEINIRQNKYSLEKANINDTATRAFLHLHRQILDRLGAVNTKQELDKLVDSVFTQWKSAQDSSVLKALYVNKDFLLGQNIHQMYGVFIQIPWMKYFVTHDPQADIAQVTCPILAINGSKDTQVDAASNLSLIEKTAKAAHNKDCTTVSLEGLNHLLQTAGTGDDGEYPVIEETISPRALQVVGDWIVKKIQ